MLMTTTIVLAILAQGEANLASCREKFPNDIERGAICVVSPWATDVVKPNGWKVVSGNDSTVALTKPGPRVGLIWVRYEYANREIPRGPLSSVQLEELDCSGGRSRTVQSTDYRSSNLAGDAFGSNPIVGTWTYPIPSSIMSSVFREGCNSDGAARVSGAHIFGMEPAPAPAHGGLQPAPARTPPRAAASPAGPARKTVPKR
jgi:hypothetical protein